MEEIYIMRQNKIVIRYIIGTALILLVPLLAVLFTDDVDWNWFDFAVFGTLLLGTSLIFELVTKKIDAKYRPVVAAILLAAMLLVWAEHAIGIFGSLIAGS